MTMALLLLLLPVLESDIAAALPPEPTPTNVAAMPLPVMLQSRTVSLLAPLASHTTALVVPALVLLIVMFWLDVVAGQTPSVTGLLDPSMVTYCALFSTKMALLLLPLITGDTPDAGFMVSVCAALAVELELMVIGKVSLP